jgi:hypothetical protein
VKLSLRTVWIVSHVFEKLQTTCSLPRVCLNSMSTQTSISYLPAKCKTARDKILAICVTVCFRFQIFIRFLDFLCTSNMIKSGDGKDALERSSFERPSKQANAISACHGRIPSPVRKINVCTGQGGGELE